MIAIIMLRNFFLTWRNFFYFLCRHRTKVISAEYYFTKKKVDDENRNSLFPVKATLKQQQTE